MNELQVFENQEFGKIRGIEIDGESWLVGKDVAESLGYADPNKAIAMHVDDEDKLNDKTASSLGQRGGWLINESGFYSLVMSSKLPGAKKFKRWVTSEVLPSIRRTGAYKVKRGMAVLPQDYASALRALADQVESNRQLEEKNSELEYQNKFLDDQNRILSGDILRWDAPAMLNAIVRKYASDHCFGNFKYAWKMFYKELLYKHSVNLESRKTRDANANPRNASRAAYKYLSDEEWPWAIKSVVALCTMDNVDISSILKEYTKEAA